MNTHSPIQSTTEQVEVSRDHPTGKVVSHSYFVCMRDHGRLGLEAVVQPEITRRGVVERIKSGEWSDVVFIHHVDGLSVEDVTAEIMAEAEADRPDDYRTPITGQDLIDWKHDRARSLAMSE